MVFSSSETQLPRQFNTPHRSQTVEAPRLAAFTPALRQFMEQPTNILHFEQSITKGFLLCRSSTSRNQKHVVLSV